jgi:hypothetical protein
LQFSIGFWYFAYAQANQVFFYPQSVKFNSKSEKLLKYTLIESKAIDIEYFCLLCLYEQSYQAFKHLFSIEIVYVFMKKIPKPLNFVLTNKIPVLNWLTGLTTVNWLPAKYASTRTNCQPTRKGNIIYYYTKLEPENTSQRSPSINYTGLRCDKKLPSTILKAWKNKYPVQYIMLNRNVGKTKSDCFP